MDTKWRKFSRSGGFKAILLLIVLGCAAAVGAITGYIPESNYFRNGLYGDVLSHSRFTDSETYAGDCRFGRRGVHNFFKRRSAGLCEVLL